MPGGSDREQRHERPEILASIEAPDAVDGPADLTIAEPPAGETLELGLHFPIVERVLGVARRIPSRPRDRHFYS